MEIAPYQENRLRQLHPGFIRLPGRRHRQSTRFMAWVRSSAWLAFEGSPDAGLEWQLFTETCTGQKCIR